MAEGKTAIDVTKEKTDTVMFFDTIQEWSVSSGPKRKILEQEILRRAQKLSLNDAQTKSLTELLSSPGEAGKRLVLSLVEIAKKQADLKQEQQALMVKEWYEAVAKQGKSMLGNASTWRMIAGWCRLFGMDDWGAYLDEKADFEAKAGEKYLATDLRHQLTETGRETMLQGIKDALDVVVKANIPESLVKIAQQTETTPPISMSGSTGTQQGVASVSDPPAVAKSVGVSIASFRQNLIDMKVPKATVDSIIGQVTEVAKSGGDTKMIDQEIEKRKLPEALAALNQTQRDQLYRKLPALNISAPELAFNK